MSWINPLLLFIALILSPVSVSAEVLELSREQVATLAISTTTLEIREVNPRLNLTGRLLADRSKVYHVAPVVDGIVVELRAMEHDRVTKGQVLARLRSNSLGQAQADYLEALARFELAETERQRVQALWQDGVVAENRWLTVDSNYKSARAALEQRKRLLSLAGLSADQIRALEKNPQHLAEFTLVSPAAGVIIARQFETGQMLSSGEAAFQIVDPSTLWAEVLIPVARLSEVTVGAGALLHVSAYPQRPFPGTLQSLGGEVDPASQTIDGRILVDNSAGLLTPGMYTQVDLAGEASRGLMAPAGAVFQVGDQAYLFSVLGPGRFEPLAVALGPQVGGWIPVTGPSIAAGTKVVSKGVSALKAHWQYRGGK